MKKNISFILVVILIVGTSIFNWNHVSAKSLDDVKDEIGELQQKKEEIKDKQGSVKSEKQETEQKIDENLSKQESVENDIDTIDQKLSNTKSAIQTKENEIKSTNQALDDLKTKIADLKQEIKELKKSIKEREGLLKERLRAIQQSGGSMKYLEVIMGSKSFGDFISRSSAVTTIMDQDRHIMESLAADKQKLESKKQEIEDKKAEIEDKKLALEGQKKELESLKKQLDDQAAEKAQLMNKLEKEQKQLENHKMSLAEQQEILQAQQSSVQKAMNLAKQQQQKMEQAAKEKAANNSGSASGNNGNSVVPSGGSGMFIWPAQGYLTDYFGTRGGNHFGIDLGNATAKSGGDVTVHAAASGVVMRAYRSTSYGNCVFITHYINGQTYQTIYAHMKYFPSVSTGQTVSQGQPIGVIGTTGDSTGPHLHFEIHKGLWNINKSNAVNPLNYLP